jgi:hypothetical protein
MCNAKSFLGQLKRHLSSSLLREGPGDDASPRDSIRSSVGEGQGKEPAGEGQGKEADTTRGAHLRTSQSLVKVTGEGAARQFYDKNNPTAALLLLLSHNPDKIFQPF